MNGELLKAAFEIIPNQGILVNMVSRRVRQLTFGHKPLVEDIPSMRAADIALTEIINKKLTFASTPGQMMKIETAKLVVLPSVIVHPEKAA